MIFQRAKTMPIQSCTKDGKQGFKWGRTGKCYTYSSEASRKRAIERARKQGRAIEARGRREK